MTARIWKATAVLYCDACAHPGRHGFRDFDFNLTPDFAGSAATIFDAWLNYRIGPELQLRAGKFKEPLGLENLQSDAVSSFKRTRISFGLGVFA